ncbi:MAG: outer membrane protein assembly factor BamE [Gammaproteobacteria bacterium]|nr:outer membrane protein assembly factor BamE [Gammaproteobacteria bacterium]
MKKCCIIMSLIIGMTSLSGCNLLSFARVHTQQGNVLSKERMQNVKIGMHKTDVAIALGTSLITPTFQKNRWDYVFTWQKSEGPVMVKRVELYFEHDKLVAIKKIPA